MFRYFHFPSLSFLVGWVEDQLADDRRWIESRDWQNGRMQTSSPLLQLQLAVSLIF